MIAVLIAENWFVLVRCTVGVSAVGFQHIVHEQYALLAFEKMMLFDFFDRRCAIAVVTSI